MAQVIDPERLKQLRKLRDLTQDELAKKARNPLNSRTPLNKQTVYRLEKGKRPARKGTIESLARGLGVDPEVLTGEKPIPSGVEQPSAPADEAAAYQLNVRIDAAIRNAFELVARRYGVLVPKIAQLAPLLFVIVAEASLKHRREKLAEFKAALGRVEELEYNFLPSFGTDDQDEKIEAEEKSIDNCDLFGRDRFDPYGVVYHEDESNPFGTYLKALTARRDDITIEALCSTSTQYRVCRLEAIELAGDEKVAEWLLNGEVPIHRMPRDLNLKPVEERIEWMTQNRIAVHKVPEQIPDKIPADFADLEI